MGHDLGHAPFGHAGEHALDDLLQERLDRRFHHNEQSVRVVEVLERDGRGLNLTREVRDGILHHTGSGTPATREGQIVRLVDRIAYVNHDIEDAVRAGIISNEDLPSDEVAVLGDDDLRAPHPPGWRHRHREPRRRPDPAVARGRAGVPALAQVHVHAGLPGAAGKHRVRTGARGRAAPVRVVHGQPR